MLRSRNGFTIVELLIVIVVIAILATISIVAYSGIQDRAQASKASQALKQAQQAIELWRVDYPGQAPDSLADAGVSDGDDTSYQYTRSTTTNPQTYCVTATVGSMSYFLGSGASIPLAGGCPGHGQGGASAVTNIAANPRVAPGGVTMINSNHSNIYHVTRGVTSPTPTPDGITTSAELRRVAGSTSDPTHLASVYNVDGLHGASPVARQVSAWVRVNADGYKILNNTIYPWVTIDLAANTWTRVQTSHPVQPNVYLSIAITKISGNASESDRAWITGIMAVEGSRHYPFSDGNSTNRVWNGATNNSTSTGPALAL